MNWRRYKVAPEMPIAIEVHICSTKVPYKTVGKEFTSDRPEYAEKLQTPFRSCTSPSAFLSQTRTRAHGKERLGSFSKYLPKLADFSTSPAQKDNFPDIQKLLKSVQKMARRKLRSERKLEVLAALKTFGT